MKNYKKVLSFTLALIMALSAVSLTAMANETTTKYGTEVLKETFDVNSPADGTAISGYNNWYGKVWDETLTNNSSNTIKKESVDSQNLVGSLLRTANTSGSSLSAEHISYNLSLSENVKRLSVKFKLRHLQENAGRFTAYFDVPGPSGSSTRSYVNYYMKNKYVYDTSGGSGTTSAPYKGIGEWNETEIVLDYINNSEIVYLNGSEVLEKKLNTNETNIYGLPTCINFGSWYNAGSWNSGMISKDKDAEFQIDDILITSYTADDLAAMAGQEVDAALAKLSDVTAITTAENLTLPTAADLGTTATVTWTSDNPAALANNGAVTKAATAQSATLTATIRNGNITKTKEFNVTILPNTVYFYDGFNSLLNINGKNLVGYDSWNENNKPDETSDTTIMLKKEESANNYYANIHRAGDKVDPFMYGVEKLTPNSAGTAKSISFRFMRGSSTTDRFYIFLFDATNQQSAYLEFYSSANKLCINNGSWLLYDDEKKNPGTWVTFDIVIDEVNDKLRVYADGKIVAKTDGTPMDAVSCTKDIAKLRVIPHRLMAATTPATENSAAGVTADFCFDDFMVREVDSDELSCIAAKDSLSFGDPVLNDLDITDEVNGTIITLDSSNTAVIANDGTVTRPDTDEITPVELTVTISKNSADIVQKYTVNVAPLYLSIITKVSVDKDSKLDAIYLTNLTQIEKAVAIAAIYTKNEDGGYDLKGVQMADKIQYLTAKGDQNVGFNENKLTVGTNDVVRVFLWQDMSTIIPVAKGFSYTYSEAEAN
ncbi:MAG: hypothetical protein IKB93_01200 [Clostridia bacterium]|nr:hypothetical protein [Clostridia bacterium]